MNPADMRQHRVVKLENDAARTLYMSLNTPVSLGCYLQLKYGCIADLLARTIDPKHYLDPYDFALDYQAVSLLRKSQRDIGVDRDAAARDAYLRMEQHCNDTNDRLLSEDWLSLTDPEDVTLLYEARRWVAVILGNLTRNKLNYAFDHMGYGKGSTLSVKGNQVCYTRKYAPRTLSTTSELLDFGIFALPEAYRRSVEGFEICDITKLAYVPKDAKTSRSIEVQPDLNIFYQLGIGKLLRSRLLWAGYPVNDQTHNQELARKGSLDGSLVTLDLSNASDTLSIAAVKRLLPSDWFELLAFGRTSRIKIGNDVINLEKFSAMGNGYTWELQTVIFNAILLAATNGASLECSSYGDDMVYPVWAHRKVLRLLSFLGFIVNERKTFWQTSFRESCGADFFDGINVRPAFFKHGDEYGCFSEVCHTYGNSLRAWAHRLNEYNSCNRIGLSAWLRCYAACPSSNRHIIPPGDSGGFHGNLEEASGTYCPTGNGWSGIHYFVRRPVVRPFIADPLNEPSNFGWYMANLNGVSNEEGIGCEQLPTPFYRTRRGYVLDWPSTLAWI